VLAGIAVFELQASEPEWAHEELRLTLDDLLQAIFTFAQRTPAPGHHLRFVLEHSANAAALNSIHSLNSAADSTGPQRQEFGVVVDSVETNFIGHTIRCFDGLTIKVAAIGVRGRLLRVGFQSTLTGWIREFRTRDE
jgi:hypothetical protein